MSGNSQSREQHADPVRLQLLREELAALEIDDSKGQASLSLSGYSMGAILAGISIFRAKREMGTFHRECDPYRYLCGIVRNIDSAQALERTAIHLLKLRKRAGELHLAPLRDSAHAIRSCCEPDGSVRKLVDAALDSDSLLTFRFWTDQAREAIGALPASHAHSLCRLLVRTIAASFNTDRRWRERLIASPAEAAAPVAA